MSFCVLAGCKAEEKTASEPVATEGWQEVHRQFLKNGDATLERFKGKRVEWSATVDFTGTGEGIEEGVLAVLSPNASTKVAFASWFANDQKDQVFALRRGQLVTVNCRLENIAKESYRVAITLEGCRLVKVAAVSGDEAPASASSQ